MDGRQAAAQRVGARQARALHGLRDVRVEKLVLLPSDVVPVALGRREERPLGIEEHAGFDKDGHAALGLAAQAVARALEEVLVLDDLVVIDEHDGVVAKDGGERQARVADSAVAVQRDALGELAQPQIGKAAMDDLDLAVADGDDVELGVRSRQRAHPRGRGGLGAGLGCHQQRDAADSAHLAQRLKAARQLPGAPHCRGVVEGSLRIALVAVLSDRPVRGDYD